MTDYCNSNATAAILDAILKITPFWLPDDNLTGLNGFLEPQNHGVDTKLPLYDKQWLIYCSSNATAAILDAILKITPFWLPDDILIGLNGFLDPQHHGVDTKITTLRQTITDLLQF